MLKRLCGADEARTRDPRRDRPLNALIRRLDMQENLRILAYGSTIPQLILIKPKYIDHYHLIVSFQNKPRIQEILLLFVDDSN